MKLLDKKLGQLAYLASHTRELTPLCLDSTIEPNKSDFREGSTDRTVDGTGLSRGEMKVLANR